jgi:hypothetical protein
MSKMQGYDPTEFMGGADSDPGSKDQSTHHLTNTVPVLDRDPVIRDGIPTHTPHNTRKPTVNANPKPQ